MRQTLQENTFRSTATLTASMWDVYNATSTGISKLGSSAVDVSEIQEFVGRDRQDNSDDDQPVSLGTTKKKKRKKDTGVQEVPLKQRGPEEIKGAVELRLLHVTRCLNLLESDHPWEEAYDSFRTAASVVREAIGVLLDREEEFKQTIAGKDKTIETQRAEIAQMKGRFDSVKGDMTNQLRIHVGEINERWRQEKTKLEALSQRLDDKLMCIDELHPKNPLVEIQEDKRLLEERLQKAETTMMTFKYQMFEAAQQLDFVRHDRNDKVNLQKDLETMHQDLKEQHRQLHMEYRQSQERAAMAADETLRWKNEAKAMKHMIGLLEDFISPMFKKLGQQVDSLPPRPEVVLARDKRNRQLEAAAIEGSYGADAFLPGMGSKAQVPLNHPLADTPLTKLMEQDETPAQKMDNLILAFRKAMSAARSIPVPAPAKSYSRMPSIKAIFGIRSASHYTAKATNSEQKHIMPPARLRALSRAILDAKTIDSFALGSCTALIPSVIPLAEFAFAWLKKYDLGDHGPVLREEPLVSEDYAAPLYWFAKSLAMHRHDGWELNTMAQLIFEELPEDAVSFFVTARHALFHGPELRDRTHYTVGERSVPLTQAQTAAGILLSSASNAEKEAFFHQVHNCKIDQKPGKVDDVNPEVSAPFLLRILVEEYLMERQARFTALDGLCEVALQLRGPQDGPPGLSMDQVFVLVENLFPTVSSDLGAVTFLVYRLAFSIGGGKVDAQSVQSAVDQLGLMHSTLRVHSLSLTPQALRLIDDMNTTVCDFLATHKRDLMKLGMVGPFARLIQRSHAQPPVESIPQGMELLHTLTRFLTMCRQFIPFSSTKNTELELERLKKISSLLVQVMQAGAAPE